ncbi:MAG: mandelate racemase/muconate lactonizing enzyme family protein [Intestinimonas sp.]|nr:mandelate racemase/muconate lactonizing enzyme family protein [Intestinimonas sp.]
MKITSVNIFQCTTGNPLLDPIFVRVNTDEGISGFGEVGFAYGKSKYGGIGQTRDLAKLMIGWDPMESEALWEMFKRNTFWGQGRDCGGIVFQGAVSALDIAIWDIKGKALGVPCYQLLGGKTNAKLRAYASQLQFDWDDVHRNIAKPEEYAAATEKAMKQGYTAIKVDPMCVKPDYVYAREPKPDPDWRTRGSLSPNVLNTAYERVKAMRDVGGSDLDIIIELHAFSDTNTAIQLGTKLEPLGIYYMEEATDPTNAGCMREIREKVNIPIASGERITTRWGFREFLEQRALQVIQPDLCVAGGLTEVKKICDMANVYDAGVQIHVCGGPIATAATLQLEAVIPNFLIHELHEGALKEEIRALCKYDHMPENGFYEVPDLPGIGNELTEKAMKEAETITID